MITQPIFSILVSGMVLGGYYSMEALGLNLIYGVLKRINLAHGDFAMLGAFTLYWLWKLYNLDIIIGAVVVVPLLFLIGLASFFTLVRPISQSEDPEMASLIVFYGVSLFMSSTALLVWGADIRGISIPFTSAPVSIEGATIPMSWVMGSAFGALAVIVLFLFLYRTKMGRQIRAVMQNREEAELVGINSLKVMAITFGLGIAFVGAFSVIQPLIFPSIYAKMGLTITITSFIITIIGGLGKPLGTVIGALIYSISYSVGVIFLGAGLAPVPAFFIMLLTLYARGGGIIK